MKSQFSKIAKIRKQKRDTIERELIKSQNKEKLLQHKIELFYEQIHTISIPKEGMFSMLCMIGEQKKVLNRDKKACEHELSLTKTQTQSLQVAYQKAHVEYEKIRYLEEQELQAIMAKLKREEQLYLDEISTQLFANQMNQKVTS